MSSSRRATAALVVLGVAVAGWTALGIGARATYGARLTADEPQYVLTAISLAEDRSLDIADELAEERYRPFHEVRLPEQTAPRSDGRRLSPHDPLLPAFLAPAVAVAGWAGAKALLAATAGLLSALLAWTAVRRFGVPLGVAVAVVAAFAAAPPFTAYGAQVYPELPAALAVAVAAAALTGPRRPASLVVAGAAVVALPWLGVKYAPVAAALAGVALWREWRGGARRRALALAGGLGVAALAYLGFHRLVYEGWTVYAAGDHFVGGELDVVGFSPNYPGRARRLYGLLVDRRFGLVPWAPAWLLVVPAVAALLRARTGAAAVLIVPLAAGWLTATFVALTMHGWWWPGRQVVVVLPLAVLAVAWWAARVRAVAVAAVVAGAWAAVTWGWLLVDAYARRVVLVVDFDATRAVTYRALSPLFPDHLGRGSPLTALDAAWLVVLVALAAVGRRSLSRHQEERPWSPPVDAPLLPSPSSLRS